MTRIRIVISPLLGWLALAGVPATVSRAQTNPAPARPAAAPAPAQAPTQAAPVVPGLDPARMNQILDAWAKKSQSTDSLHARFIREDYADDWQTKTRYSGAAFVKRPNLAYLNFDKMPDDPAGKPVPNERIICTGTDVYQFLTETKQVHVYPLPPEERARALEEGPLPFLFNMDAAKIKARYAIRLVGEKDNLFLIGIKPLTDQDREAFSLAYIWLDASKFQPTKIQLHDPSNPKNTKTYTFSEVGMNRTISDAYFDAKSQWQQVRPAGWDLVMHDLEGKPVAGAGVAAPAAGTAPAAGQRSASAPRPPAATAAQPAQPRAPVGLPRR
jgi:TIGR03009 family protein